MGVHAGRGFGVPKPKRLRCPDCGKKGVTQLKLAPNAVWFRDCQYCGASWTEASWAIAKKDAAAHKPFGWYCELVHIESGEVVNSNFFRDGPITGAGKVGGTEWRATPLFTQGERRG